MRPLAHSRREMTPALELVWASVAIAGGVTKYLSESMRNKQPPRPAPLLVRAFISGFSGWMFAHLAVSFTDESNFVVICAGVGGYLGTEALDFMAQWAKDRLKGPPAA